MNTPTSKAVSATATNSPKGARPQTAPSTRTAVMPKVRHGLIMNAVYKHYKGESYRILAVAKMEEGGALYVVYEALDTAAREEDPWTRPHAEFMGTVTRDDKTTVPRFLLSSL